MFWCSHGDNRSHEYSLHADTILDSRLVDVVSNRAGFQNRLSFIRKIPAPAGSYCEAIYVGIHCYNLLSPRGTVSV